MASKDFSQMNTTAVYSAIEAATAEPAAEKKLKRRSRDTEPTAAEENAAREQHRTQGRKGCAALRVNMSFSPAVHDYIRVMSQARGESITAFTEAVFTKSMEENKELYEQALKFRENFK